MAKNLLIDRFRTSTRQRTEPLLDDDARLLVASDPGPARRAVASDDLQRIEKIVAGLSPHCREVFVLNRSMGLSYAAIAQLLHISQGTVEKHMATAILACKTGLRERPV